MNEAIVMLAVVLPLMFCAGGVLVILMGMYQHMKTLEMKHRERLAMIERGLAPPPERDPEAFATFEYWQQRRHRNPPGKSTSIGIVIVALGLGLSMIIGFAAETPNVAVGLGGAIIVLGTAFIVNGELHRRSRPAIHLPEPGSPQQPPPYPPPPSGRSGVQPPLE